jgi:hypothetical protein
MNNATRTTHLQSQFPQDVRANYLQISAPETLRRLFHAGADFPLVNDLQMFLPVAHQSGIERINL